MDFTRMDRAALGDYATTDDLLDIIEALREGTPGHDQAVTQTAPVPEGEPLTFMYTNWRGESAERRAIPQRIYWGSTDWHSEPQWLMAAFDTDKQAERVFAMKDMQSYAPRTVQITFPAEKGRAEMVGFHWGKPLVWTHRNMEHRIFDPSFIKPKE